MTDVQRRVRYIVAMSFVSYGGLGCNSLESGSPAGSEPTQTESASTSAEKTSNTSRQLFTKEDKEVFARAQKARDSLCPSLCETSVQAGCSMKQSECLGHCAKLADTVVCPDENAAFIQCSVSKPATDFECSPVGFASLKGHLCLKEKAAMIDCVRTAMAP